MDITTNYIESSNYMENNKIEYLFGMHPVIEALRASKKVEKVMLKTGLEGPMFHDLMELLVSMQIPYQFVPLEKLNRLVRGAHQGVVAQIASIDYVGLEEFVNNALARSEHPLVVILDGVTDVRNVGAIARSLECAGGRGIIIPSKGGAALNADAIKASAGALMRIDTCKVQNLKVAAYYLRQSGFSLIAATEKSDVTMYEVDMTGACAIIVGSEGSGISPALLKIADAQASIPLAGEISSLNVSVATSLVLYEAVRQRLAKE